MSIILTALLLPAAWADFDLTAGKAAAPRPNFIIILAHEPLGLLPAVLRRFCEAGGQPRGLDSVTDQC